MITGDHKLTAVAVAKELGICREGDMAALRFKQDKLHLFDKETEKAIAH